MVVSVQVAVRVRPPLQTNQAVEDVCVCAVPHTKQVILGNQSCFTADYVFSADYSQGYVYDVCVAQRVNFLLEGYDISVIAYGRCNSGKTYTMFGPGLNCSLETQHGMILRATRHIFNTLTRHQQYNGTQYKVFISFFEVVNGVVHDLLSPSQQRKEFTLTTDEKGSTLIAGLENIQCQNVNEVFNCLRIGMRYRQTVWTNYNAASSQSHCFFTFTVQQQWIVGGRLEKRISKGTFVDLGSTEVVYYMGPNGQILHQNSSNNLGLRALSNIITALPNEQWVIPHHVSDPLLTTIIKDAFTVSSHTLLICCLSPGSVDYVDTLNHLRLIDQVHSTYGFSHQEEHSCDVNTATSSQELVFDNSENGSTQADSFGLEFAASQWMKLVSNAEGLFQKLFQTGLSKDAKEQIEQWLCMKQECEECLAQDSSVSLQGKTTRSLERIDEVTESEEKSSSEKTVSESEVESESGVDDTAEVEVCNEADNIGDPRRQDFAEKLEILMNSFRNSTDIEVNKYSESLNYISDKINPQAKILTRNSNNGRRKSILPGDMPLKINERRQELEQTVKEEVESSNESHNAGNKETCSIKEEGDEVINNSSSVSFSEKTSQKLQLEPRNPVDKELKMLSTESESKQSQIDMVILDLEGANKRIDELQQMIQIKEQFIVEMIQNSGARTTAKARFQRKLAQLEEEYCKARANLAKAEKALNRGDSSVKGQVDKYKALASRYERRLHDLELIKQLAGDSAKKVVELESSLHNSKRKLQKLVKQLRKEEEHKLNLEQELIEDQKRMKELEEKYKLQSDKIKEDAVDGDRLKWIAEEEERLMNLRESSQRLQEQLNEQQSILEKRESFLKEKICQEKNVNKSILHVSARISHLEQVLKEKSTTLEQAENLEAKEALRHEIRNLRKTRDCLVEQRRNLDAKLNKDKVFSTVDERKFLECDEAIEAIDATIEYKNELMCGHKGIGSTDVQREKGEEMLMERLMKLSEPEMRSLLYKYFQKVIDLRESGRKMEQQIAEQDQQIEAQAWKIQALSNALQQANIESERRLVMVHREHQEKLHLMFRHYAGETSGASSVEREGDKLHTQNKALRHRVLELEAMLYASKGSIQHKNQTTNALTIPQQNLKKLQGAVSAHTTKVTRQKNKLIIQQQKARKQSK